MRNNAVEDLERKIKNKLSQEQMQQINKYCDNYISAKLFAKKKDELTEIERKAIISKVKGRIFAFIGVALFAVFILLQLPKNGDYSSINQNVLIIKSIIFIGIFVAIDMLFISRDYNEYAENEKLKMKYEIYKKIDEAQSNYINVVDYLGMYNVAPSIWRVNSLLSSLITLSKDGRKKKKF